MAQPLTPEEEEQLKELRRRKAAMTRNQNRVRKYSPRIKSVQLEAKEEKKVAQISNSKESGASK